jgi:hypothetical protein
MHLKLFLLPSLPTESYYLLVLLTLSFLLILLTERNKILRYTVHFSRVDAN